MATMRSLHVALSSYVRDVGKWPQEPEELWLAENSAPLEDWWFETLGPFGGGEKAWRCPTISRLVARGEEKDTPRMHYGPTRFDDKPLSPFRWATQPWLVEIGDMHGRGAHIIFPDGSIRVMSDFLPKSE